MGRAMWWWLVWGIFLARSLAAQELTAEPVAAEKLAGVWRGALESRGGPVKFGLVLTAEDQNVQAFVTNGPETIKVPQVGWDGRLLRLGFDHFQSAIEAELRLEDDQLSGQYTRMKAGRIVARLPFAARREVEADREFEPADKWMGKWQVRFGESSEPAIGLFRPDPPPVTIDAFGGTPVDSAKAVAGRAVVGTFLTPTGDYRYLAGGVRAGVLELSCFDGTHVYLFRSRFAPAESMPADILPADNSTTDRLSADHLLGEFWSGGGERINWVGKRDQAVRLPDGFTDVTAAGAPDWGSLQFPDTKGQLRRLDDPEFRGRARLIYLFGSWCPNCHDAAEFFGQLQREYGPQGLQILGLAFEATGDFASDLPQVEIYARRHQIDYPLLLAGLADKEIASRSLPFLQRVRAFPTALIVDDSGRVQAVYSGFNGPATGEAYAEQSAQFRRRIEGLLSKQSK